MIILGAGLALRRGHWPYAILAGVMLAHVFLTGIRSGWLGLAAALALVLTALALRRRFASPVRAVAATCLTWGILGVIGIASIVALTWWRTGSGIPLDSSILLRYNSNLSGIYMLAEHPIRGFGPGVYVIENPRFWTPYEQEWFAVGRKMNAHVHNDYLETAVDGGIPALGLYAVFLAGLIVYGLFNAQC